MRIKITEECLARYPYLQHFLKKSNRKYNLNSDEDLVELFNKILSEIHKKKKENDNQTNRKIQEQDAS